MCIPRTHMLQKWYRLLPASCIVNMKPLRKICISSRRKITLWGKHLLIPLYTCKEPLKMPAQVPCPAAICSNFSHPLYHPPKWLLNCNQNMQIFQYMIMLFGDAREIKLSSEKTLSSEWMRFIAEQKGEYKKRLRKKIKIRIRNKKEMNSVYRTPGSGYSQVTWHSTVFWKL